MRFSPADRFTIRIWTGHKADEHALLTHYRDSHYDCLQMKGCTCASRHTLYMTLPMAVCIIFNPNPRPQQNISNIADIIQFIQPRHDIHHPHNNPHPLRHLLVHSRPSIPPQPNPNHATTISWDLAQTWSHGFPTPKTSKRLGQETETDLEDYRHQVTDVTPSYTSTSPPGLETLSGVQSFDKRTTDIDVDIDAEDDTSVSVESKSLIRRAPRGGFHCCGGDWGGDGITSGAYLVEQSSVWLCIKATTGLLVIGLVQSFL